MKFLIVDSISESINGVTEWKQSGLSVEKSLALVNEYEGYYESSLYSLETIDFDFTVSNVGSFESFLSMIKDCFISEEKAGRIEIFMIKET